MWEVVQVSLRGPPEASLVFARLREPPRAQVDSSEENSAAEQSSIRTSDRILPELSTQTQSRGHEERSPPLRSVQAHQPTQTDRQSRAHLENQKYAWKYH
ncbi:hypothetical protein SRHO_G00031760 [Serrasalmus rhombeus]